MKRLVQDMTKSARASWENLISLLLPRLDWPAQPQRLARYLTFRTCIYKHE